MSAEMYEAIVIGAGGMGSAAAYHLARSGARVLVLEQFSRGHAHGSSHGETRAIRYYYDRAFYTELMKPAYAEWRRLEEEAGKNLLFITGGVLIAPEGHDFVELRRAILEEAGIESEQWDRAQLAARFPQFRVEEGTSVLWQKDAGFLHASACVAAHQQLAARHGAEIREATPVAGIDWQGDGLEVVAKGERFRARKVIVTAGSWTGKLLGELELPLEVTRQQVVYYRPADAALFQLDRFPVFGDITWGEVFYGFPEFGPEGVKVARDGLGLDVVDPDTCDRTPDQSYIEHLRAFLQERIPAAAGAALEAHVCLYTESRDRDFIIDTHPQCSELILAAGFSGHGFKFCALVGRILAQMALEGGTEFDISPFSLARFQP